jgi:acetylornithine deacetylase/succinyl-diaminopimelate desuccinylase-like protein
MLATLLARKQDGTGPRRDVVFAFVADEEEDGQLGAEWLVREHPDLFAEVEAAIGESGGVPVRAVASDGTQQIIVPVAVAERGSLHMSVETTGTAGHGSRPNVDNAVAQLVHALSRLAGHRWPLTLTPTLRAFLSECGTALQLPVDLSSEDEIECLVAELGPLKDFVQPALRSSTNLTVLEAGYKMNVIPSTARAEIDVRSAPGQDDEVLATIDQLLGPGVVRTMLSQSPAISAPIDSPWFDAISSSIRTALPGAVVVPFCMAGGTDAKPFAKLGIHGYGFAPLGLDPEGRTGSGIHGVDERVPVAALEGSVAILRQFLETV